MLLKNKIVLFKAFILLIIVVCITAVYADEHAGKSAENQTTMPQYNWNQMTPAMKKSVSPDVMKKMMGWMSRPQDMMTMENCQSCHEGEQLARIAKDWGPMLASMKPMVDMMNPMTGMVEPMINPMISMMHPMADMMAPMMNMMGPMMSPMTGMIGPSMAMMNPMMNMMGPSMAMMNPMMNMMTPMMGSMMNPASYMNPAFYMNMMGPMMGMMGPMMMGMGGMNMMNPMMGSMGVPQDGNPMNQMSQMMDPKQYEQWFKQWTDMMNNTSQPSANSNQ